MHDFHGKPLAVGDEVVIPCRITALHPTPEYCNVEVESVLGRRPDGQKSTFSAINTAQLIKVEEVMIVQPATPDGDHATEPVIVGDPVAPSPVAEPTAADLDECAREAGEKTDDEA